MKRRDDGDEDVDGEATFLSSVRAIDGRDYRSRVRKHTRSHAHVAGHLAYVCLVPFTTILVRRVC